MPNSLPFPSSVPIIGEPAVRDVFVTAVINCACPSKRALMLSGFGNVVLCQDCGSHWTLQNVSEGRMAVMRVVPREEQPAS